ncbi:unnamed protein product [Miscanthus lutarioriparius]|uniref:DNL-type domain-containing protein n=1 Tax=Miscanthus lutarioriparius TaxID=422564 RepID=A0A811SBJ8_9POAL|nr:unnamed protein product [Miscanthus lutarioriparius]
MDIWWGCLLEPFRPSAAKRRNLLARPAPATALRPDLPCGKRIQVGVGGYGDDGRRVQLLRGGAAALRVVSGDPFVPPGASSSSRVPCGLLLEVQGTGTAEAAVDIKLPRRSLLVQFTCNACGERTKRLINRVAYESGTVFLQCAGCQVYHKFVDNLGLVVEYDLREENELQGENVVNPNSED